VRKSPIPADLLSRLPKRAILAVLVAGALGAGGWYAYDSYKLSAASAAAADARAHEALAKGLATKVGSSLDDVRAALDGYAENPKVVSALTGDPSARQRVGDELGKTIPGTLLLRLVPAGTVEPDTSQQPPLTYASIDLLRQAAAQEKPVSAELHLGGTDDAHIAIVRRVPPVGAPVGFLHLALQPVLVRDVVAKLDGQGFEVELRQAASGAPPLIIAKQGEAADGRVDVAQAAVPGTTWQVVLRHAGRPGAGQTGFSLDSLILPAGAIALAGLAVVLMRPPPRGRCGQPGGPGAGIRFSGRRARHTQRRLPRARATAARRAGARATRRAGRRPARVFPHDRNPGDRNHGHPAGSGTAAGQARGTAGRRADRPGHFPQPTTFAASSAPR
jgi:hypothetical protein